MQQGNSKRAVKSLNNALKINPNLGDALLSLASIYRDKNQLTQAKLMYVRAQALPKYQLSAWLGLSQIAIDSKNYPEALKHLKKAYQANPQRQDLITNIRALENIVRQEG
jgi:tetratricopeptide (TPR) repeat protein